MFGLFYCWSIELKQADELGLILKAAGASSKAQVYSDSLVEWDLAHPVE